MLIEHSLRADKTPAFALLAEGWNELVQEGLTPEGQGLSPVAPSHEVLYAFSDAGDIVGVIAFEVEDTTAKVSLAFVEPSSRKRGVFRALLAFMKAAEHLGIDRIEIEAPVENQPFQAVMRRLNSPAISVRYELAS